LKRFYEHGKIGYNS